MHARWCITSLIYHGFIYKNTHEKLHYRFLGFAAGTAFYSSFQIISDFIIVLVHFICYGGRIFYG
jgi:hypothetical protein